jgi:hypothetical protein
MRRMPLVTALAAMQAVCRLQLAPVDRGVDVPCAVLVTRHDTVVPPSRQMRLARAARRRGRRGRRRPRRLPRRPGAFAHALAAACLAVAPAATGGPATPNAPADRRAHARAGARPEVTLRVLGDPGACAAPAHAAVPRRCAPGAGRTASRISSPGR